MKCFHHTDLDGHCSGAIVKESYAEAELISFNWGDEIPWDSITPGEVVFMCDVGMPVEDYRRMNSIADFYLIDHHQSNLQDIEEAGLELQGLCDVQRSGCELTWEWLHPDEPEPDVVRLLGRYDVWDTGPGMQEEYMSFQYGMRARETDPSKAMDLWEDLFDAEMNGGYHMILSEISNRGKDVLAYLKSYYKEYAEKAVRTVEFAGHRWAAINCVRADSSIGDSVLDPQIHDGVMLYGQDKTGSWDFSLYANNNKSVDCAKIAQQFGGGGHPGAAGASFGKELPEFLR